MARVNSTRMYIGLTYRDNDGNTSSNELPVPIGDIVDIAGAFVYANALIALVDGLTDAVIEKSSIRFEALETDPALLDAPEESEVSRKGRFVFKTVENTPATLEIPSIRNALVVDGSNTISPLDPAVAAFILAVLQGPPGEDNGVVTGAGIQYNRFVRAFKAHRSSSDG